MTLFNASPKINRNSLCPCGCGLKFKKCQAAKKLKAEQALEQRRLSDLKKPRRIPLDAPVLAVITCLDVLGVENRE